MQLTQAQVKKILSYNGNLQLSQLGMKLLLTRLKGIYQDQSASTDAVNQCTGEINAFLTKFGTIMQKDYETIIKI